MNKKRTLATVIVLAVLCLLIYFQVRTWRRFDWAAFWNETHHIRWIGIAGGIGFTYLTVYLRAVRWRIFLKPIRKTTATALLGPQFVGFTALALLGRAGEVVRPYLIAKKENVTLTSQLGVWTVERIFDMGAFAVMLSLSFLSPDLRSLAFYGRLRLAAVALLVLIAGLVIGALALHQAGGRIANSLASLFANFAPRFAHHLREKLLAFSEGLQTIHDVSSAVQLTAISIVIWVVVALAYISITHAYPSPIGDLSLPQIIILMGSSMVGSLLQLPAVGGGSQLAAISMLHAGFGASEELSVSCGMLIWVCTFMSVIPVGLALAHRERLSLRAVAAAEKKEEAALAE
ncbi:MAG: lysylphosphatidylglycerol synthase transmembrane domain-containing protein [Candidatus Korobacteraceae bacterium]